MTDKKVNTSPVAVDDSYTVSEDSILYAGKNGTQGVLSNDTDGNNDKLSAVLLTSPGNTLFKFNTDGSFVFDASNYDSLAAGASHIETFTYRAYDGQAYSNTATVTITIIGINDKPVALDDSATTSASATPILIDVLNNDTDVDVGDTKTIIALDDLGDATPLADHVPSGNGTTTIHTDAGGIVTLSEGKLLYTPDSSFFGVDTFQYTVSDGQGATATATVSVTVTPKNTAPTATDDAYTVGENGVLTVSATGVLGNDTDPDVDALSAMLVTDPTQGELDYFNVDGSFSYDPNGAFEYLGVNETGTVTFTYQAFDGSLASNTATVTLTINGENDPVTITTANDKGAVQEDTDVSATSTLISKGTIAFNDVDLTNIHTAKVSADSGNTLGGTLNTTVSEDSGSSAGTVAWVYEVANSATQYLAQGQQVQEIFTAMLDDGFGSTVPQTITITITGTNDVPIITAGSYGGNVTEYADKSPNENTGTQTVSGTMPVTDVDLRDIQTVTFAPQEGSYLGTFTPSITDNTTNDGTGIIDWSFSVADSALDYLAAGQTLTQTYAVTVNDGQGGTATQNVVITLTGTNDVPIIAAGSYGGNVTEYADKSPNENTGTQTVSGTMPVTDVDLRDIQTVTFAPQEGSYLGTFTPSITDNTTNDGTGIIDWSFSVADSALDYLAAGQTLTQTYAVTVNDGQGGTATQNVVITLTGTNDVPIIAAGSYGGNVTEYADKSPNENTGTQTVSGTMPVADVDLKDIQTVTFAPQGTSYLGTFTPSITDNTTNDGVGSIGWSFSVADSALDYLAAGQTLTQTYAVTVNDGQGGTATQNVVITLTGTNDAPIITPGLYETTVTEYADKSPNENTGTQTVSGTMPVADVDLKDIQTVTFAPQGTSYLGTFTPSITDNTTNDGVGSIGWSFSVADSALDYLAAGQTLTQTYAVTVNDGQGGTATQNVDITLRGTNDAPTAVDDTWAYSSSTPNPPNKVTANDTDPDQTDTLTVIGLATVENGGSYGTMTLITTSGGTVNMSADGSYTYVPKTGFFGTDSFAYKIQDNAGATDTATVTINVEAAPTLADRFFINELGVNAGASNITIDTDNGPAPNTVTTGTSRIEMINNATNAVSTADLRSVHFEIVNPDGHLDVISGDQLTGLTVDKAGKFINGSAISGNGRLVIYEPDAAGYGIWQVYNNTTLNSSGTYKDTSWNLGNDVTKPVAVNIAQGSFSIDLFAANGAKLSGLIGDDTTQSSLTGVGTLGQAPHALGSVVPFVLPQRDAAWYSGVQLKPSSNGIPQDVLDAVSSQNAQFNGSLASSQDHVFARVYDRYLASNKGSSVDSVFVDHNDAGDWTYGADNMLTTGFKNVVSGAVANSLDSSDNLNPNQGTNVHGDVIASITNEDGQTNAIFSGAGRGGAGHDFLYGVATADSLSGDGGNDLLYGSAGDDVLDGGKGGDVLIGGADSDKLTGGTGSDVFVYDTVADWSATETITDFGAGGINTQTLTNVAISGLTGDILRFDLSNLAALPGYSALKSTAPTGTNGSTLVAEDFVSGSGAVATAAHAQFVQDTHTGVLYFDADGTGSMAATAVAIVGTAPVTPNGILLLA